MRYAPPETISLFKGEQAANAAKTKNNIIIATISFIFSASRKFFHSIPLDGKKRGLFPMRAAARKIFISAIF
ncbi:MAG: hypothetical protein FWE85_05745 [Clostridiales bacterium]|nr:hypothetical protein [Clostridiales bacterium]